MTTLKEKYPEHEKLNNIKEMSQQLGSFIDWAQNSGYSLHEYRGDDEDHGYWAPTRKDVNQLLSEYYKINLIKLEEEKCQMLDELRNR